MEAFTNILAQGFKTWETNLEQRQPPVDLRVVVFALAAWPPRGATRYRSPRTSSWKRPGRS